MIERILERVAAHADDILAGRYEALRAPPFAGFALHVSPNGSTVIALQFEAAALAALPASHRSVDLFLLAPHAQLGRHFHRRATAHVHMVRGAATAEVDGEETHLAPGGEACFPARAVHDVRSGSEAVLFASFQDHPILQPDGSQDYVSVGG